MYALARSLLHLVERILTYFAQFSYKTWTLNCFSLFYAYGFNFFFLPTRLLAFFIFFYRGGGESEREGEGTVEKCTDLPG